MEKKAGPKQIGLQCACLSKTDLTPGAVTGMQILSRWAKMGAARETCLELTSLEGAG
ncbi:hypothetical protein DPMN_101436 [Dreissena polymorpha]|uniref:Uncharacterized protein n=1 Tax=Dreissena polymorpha TaxID=45954 RepID=A0A9D4LHK2_DREPO|nr:hypothetical protein DPMN_101436 [Dreissena polymorpha]